MEVKFCPEWEYPKYLVYDIKITQPIIALFLRYARTSYVFPIKKAVKRNQCAKLVNDLNVHFVLLSSAK